jgi:hypothetical protein
MAHRSCTACAALACALAGLAPVAAGGLVQPAFDLDDFDAPLAIDNPYWPLPVGLRVVYAEASDEECIVNDFVVTADVKGDFGGDYAGLRARVVSDTEWRDQDCDGGRDVLLEDTFDWYAQDDAGNIWYFGEDTTEFLYDEAGNPVGSSTAGSWEAGVDGAVAGLIMLATPTPGAQYRQEFYAGVAEDEAKVVGLDRRVDIGLGTFTGCLVTKETSPLSPGTIEHKHYCPGQGLLLVEHVSGGPKTFVEAIEIDAP